MICVIGRALPTIPTILPTNASRPDESISIHDGAVPCGVVIVMSQRPISLTSRIGLGRRFACAIAVLEVRTASIKAKQRVIECISESSVASPRRLPIVGNARVIATGSFGVALRLRHSDFRREIAEQPQFLHHAEVFARRRLGYLRRLHTLRCRRVLLALSEKLV